MLEEFIRGVPKAELHLHIEGTLEPEMMLAMAARNGVEIPFSSAAEARAAYRFDDLCHFLRLYYQGVNVLCTERDFHELTTAYARRVRADGARHVEVFFDPQSHLPRGIPFAAVVGGITGALDEAEREFGLSWRLVMCFLRDQSAAGAMECLQQALPFRDSIVGVGLDSAEVGHPPSAFIEVFARARDAGFVCVAHAGEEGPAEYVAEVLDQLRVRRVDHGVAAIEDPGLIERLVREQIPLTMCPLSNLELQVTPDLHRHPLKRLLDAGVCVTINSDDPAYFDGYLAANYLAARQALDLSAADIRTLARNSIVASLLPQERQAQLLAEIDAFMPHVV